MKKQKEMNGDQLFEKAAEFELDEGVELTRTNIFPTNQDRNVWIVRFDRYLLSREGWRITWRHSADYVCGEMSDEEISHAAETFIFSDPVEAASFYELHCAGPKVKPAFDLAVVKLRTYLDEHFPEECDLGPVIKAACLMRREQRSERRRKRGHRDEAQLR